MIAAAPAAGRRLRVAGAGRSAAYGEDDGFVVVLTREPLVETVPLRRSTQVDYTHFLILDMMFTRGYGLHL